ncbi:hypothetical protein [Ligilactobacillus apodemi]|uniref:Uncharacterized protein n=1 Tax=Ligilactobacillus apodemi DSM 16634 = JCM 16172 TaxID=1423724 RepID=A0A0R1TQT9_9LACO|nr:hypothetical protein [Ligilactobacillus apodemi]KRL83807.1 hypothetical protein FC32_GL001069 [Ligilactobacillus apodemi DSM 16634 = JCM 16172]
MLKNKKVKIVVITILGLSLIGGAGMAIIKGVQHLRIERQKQKKAESIRESKKEVADQAEARQKIALWVVQNYEVAEPIEEIKVGKIKTYGIVGAGGRATSVMINNNKKYVIDGISVAKDGTPEGNAMHGDEVKHVSNSKKTLDGVAVKYWEE